MRMRANDISRRAGLRSHMQLTLNVLHRAEGSA